ncbi:hypothetical protein BSL78_02838 [Apostichopus japonicus]|uniref:Uncharacterized protein n=1 Tax=Stichopus japonicus TaxID=307972 RepID=A0A2G8LIZ7_STIJA|nr:hypothetical protein BSL78_02838 [Apostichopus japonicus]
MHSSVQRLSQRPTPWSLPYQIGGVETTTVKYTPWELLVSGGSSFQSADNTSTWLGCYEIPEGLVFSLPVKFHQGSWRVVEDAKQSPETVEEVSEDNNNKKVFGVKEGSDSTPGVSDVQGPTNGEENEITRSGPLSRIAEESETDTKEGTTVTETDEVGKLRLLQLTIKACKTLQGYQTCTESQYLY